MTLREAIERAIRKKDPSTASRVCNYLWFNKGQNYNQQCEAFKQVADSLGIPFTRFDFEDLMVAVDEWGARQ